MAKYLVTMGSSKRLLTIVAMKRDVTALKTNEVVSADGVEGRQRPSGVSILARSCRLLPLAQSADRVEDSLTHRMGMATGGDGR